MFVIVAYDMVDNRRRAKVHKKLKNYITHIQGSVFEGYMNKNRISKMIKDIIPLIDSREDSLRIWRIPEKYVKEVIEVGLPELLKENGFYIS